MLLPKKDKLILINADRDYTVYCYGVLPGNLHLKKYSLRTFGGGIRKISCGGTHALFLTQSNQLKSIGDNRFGQCGKDPQSVDCVGELTDVVSPSLKGTKILDIATGSNHSLVLSSRNNVAEVLAFGHETACGFLDRKRHHQPTPIQFSHPRITSIFAGRQKSVLIVDEKELYIWGSIKLREPECLELALEPLEKLKKVALGKEFGLLLTSSGKIYSWGDNSYGELGFPVETRSVESPARIPFFEDLQVLDVAAGARHSLVLEGTGRIFSFGDNNEGQCAVDDNRSYSPEEIHSKGLLGNSKIATRFIWAGDAHSALVTDEGDMYAWGDNTANRLGMGNKQTIAVPRMVEELLGKTICNVGLGNVFNLIVTGPQSQSLVESAENKITATVFEGLMGAMGKVSLKR